MKVKELIKELKKFNQDADVWVSVSGRLKELSISWGYAEDCTKENCREVYIDAGGVAGGSDNVE